MLISDDNDNWTGRPSGPELRPDNISVAEDDDDNTRNPIVSTSESVMENAIAEGLATALHNILLKISGTLQPFPNHRHMPHHKRNEDREVALEKATEPSHHCDFTLAEVHCLFKWLGCLIRTLGYMQLKTLQLSRTLLKDYHLPYTYDGAWIASLTEHQKESLEILTAPFPWMKVAVV
ncbi:hypothetical protein EDC04DRAFT_2597916 [Pisolithus marmoratus]|nr:hypothetical protein EDC04DRAFT_2597916 [Pisolithus marmoratus]